jgi:hypothetical protein
MEVAGPSRSIPVSLGCKRLRRRPTALMSLRRPAPSGYEAGVKNPVAVPKSRKVARRPDVEPVWSRALVFLTLLRAGRAVQRSKATTPLRLPTGRGGIYSVACRRGILQPTYSTCLTSSRIVSVTSLL